MCGVVPRILARGSLRAPVASPQPGRGFGRPAFIHTPNVRRFIVHKEQAFVPPPVNPPGPNIIADGAHQGNRGPWKPALGRLPSVNFHYALAHGSEQEPSCPVYPDQRAYCPCEILTNSADCMCQCLAGHSTKHPAASRANFPRAFASQFRAVRNVSYRRCCYGSGSILIVTAPVRSKIKTSPVTGPSVIIPDEARGQCCTRLTKSPELKVQGCPLRNLPPVSSGRGYGR